MFIFILFKQECDLGQQSILHAVKARIQPVSKRSLNVPANASIEEDPNEEHDATKPLSQTLTALQFSDSARDTIADKGKRDIQSIWRFHYKF